MANSEETKSVKDNEIISEDTKENISEENNNNLENIETATNECSSFSALCECVNLESGCEVTNQESGKTVIVLGNKKSAESAIKLLELQGNSVLQCDKTFKFKTLKYLKVDKAIVSPGISLCEKLVKKIIKNKISLYSEVNLGLENSKGNFFGITGSNGKTTTTLLTKHILSSKYKESFALGNCGTPLSSEASNLTEKSYVALELSSFMLELPLAKKLATAVVLNLSPDHLDRYKNFKEYYKTKLKIFDSVVENGNLIFNYDDKILLKESKNKKYSGKNIWYFSESKKVTGTYIKNNEFIFNNGLSEVVIGEVKSGYERFGLLNILASILICKLAGVSSSAINSKLNSFKGVEHRLYTVCKKNGLTFINDSKSTNCESTIFALNNIEPKKVVLLLGGSSKMENYNKLFKTIRDKGVKNVICFGQIRQKLIKTANKYRLTNVFAEEKMEDAVINAKAIATSGDFILLSPAAASFDEFSSFEQRGDKFIELVKAIKEK